MSDPNTQFEELKSALLAQIGKTFPIQDKSGQYEVRVRDLKVQDSLGVDDIKSQHKARVEGRSWVAPVTATVDVVDVKNNKVLVSREQRIADIPKMSRHYSWIIGGQEMTLSNQWRLRPGAYVKATERPGEYEAQFQLAKGKSFDIQQEENGGLYMKVGTRKVPLYSVLHATGVSDDEMKKSWGDVIFDATKKKSKPKDFQSFYEAWKGDAGPSGTNYKEAVGTLLNDSKIDPEITHINLGVRAPSVNNAMLLAASKKLIDVSAEKVKPDPIDSLVYKELWTAKDHMMERLERSQKDIVSRVQGVMKKGSVQDKLRAGDATVLRDIVPPELIRKPMYTPFLTQLAAVATQTNPISMLAGRSSTTLMGPGGIRSEHQLNTSNTAIDPSHLGFLDPVFTPEGNPGVTTHLAYGVRAAADRRPVTTLYNLKTGKLEEVDAGRAAHSHIVLPDQVTWSGGKPKPRVDNVKVIDNKGELRNDIPFHSADYVIPSTAQAFALETNLVPFMQNDSAGRTTMSARHMAQAISVVGREPPLVRVAGPDGRSFEEHIGNTFLGHTSPVNGTVTKVDKDGIQIKDEKGGLHTVQIYNYYPTNNEKGMLHSTPLVKVGAKVKKDQVVADNNYTKDGLLSLGTNLRTAYLANGFNHEDGITISESAAKKLASEHLSKPSLFLGDDTVVEKKAFLYNKGGVYTPERLQNIDEGGVIKVGSKVKPGDPLILALNASKPPTGIGADTVERLGRKLRNPYGNGSLVWDSQYEGEVVSVHRQGREIVVHVKTVEPAQIGSKISTRHSAKGIVSAITPDHEMPVNEKGQHVEMLINPVSVPGRNNPGQILETVAGRIAEKTGKPYVVKNFQGGVDYLAKIKEELKQHGLKDTDTLYDPKTGRRLGEVLTGPHYAFQLEHQIDKKTFVRSGGPPLKQAEAPILHYDADTKIPRGGGHHGAQSLGSLGIGAALSSGLHDNLLEMQTLKCFVWSTPVITERGAIPIGKIVNQKMDVRVLSWNEANKTLEYKKITNYWKRNREAADRLVELRVHGSNDFGMYRTRKIKCTETHKIYTHDGRKINAGDSKGETLATPGLLLNKTQYALLVGSLLGDGSLLTHNGPFPHFQERHCKAQEEYLRMKRDILQEFSDRNDVYEYNAGDTGFNCGQQMVEWSTLAHPGFTELHEVFYPCGQKIIPERLEEMLSPFAIAIWYQDDGSLVHGDRQRILRIHLGTVSEEGAKRAAEALSRVSGVSFEAKPAPQDYKGRISEQWNLRIGRAEDIDRFINYVRPYIHPSLGYKVDGLPCGEELASLVSAQAETTLFPVVVQDVTPYEPSRFDGGCLFDLEVEDTHNYFAHGVRVSNSDQPQASAVWAAITNGEMLPPPKVPFAFQRFEAMLKGMGVNVEKDGTKYRIMPRTDAETRAMSRGQIHKPTRGVRAKDDAPERDGIFDPTITGGRDGIHWGHIELAEAMPHPIFAAPIAGLLKIKASDIPDILAGEKTLEGQSGPKAFTAALKKVNVDETLKTLKAQLENPKVKGEELNKANYLYKSLAVLKESKKHPADAWMIKAVPVIPPVFRPIATLPDGTTRNNPLNRLYQRLGAVNESIQRGEAAGVPWNSSLNARAGMYQELSNLFGTTSKSAKAYDLDMRGTREDTTKKLPGILHIIAGEHPKDGYFQDKLTGKKQDYTSRATIVGDPTLSADQIGVPKKIAIELMRPMVVQRLVRSGYDAVKANLMVSRKDPLAVRALEEEVKHRPVLMKRDPVLHQYGLVGQNIQLIDTPAIKVSPLVLPPIGGDIDGDTVSLFVPLSAKAIEETKRILPSQRTLSDSSGDVLYTPANEAALALYRTSLARTKQVHSVYATAKDAEAAFVKNKINLDTVIHIKGVGDTTLGRTRIAEVVPEKYRKDILTNLDKSFDRKYQQAVLQETAKEQPKHFLELADNLSRLGFQMAYESGHTVSLRDLEPLRAERDAIIAAARKKIETLPKGAKGLADEKQIWLDATKQLHETYGEHYKKNPTNVSDMAVSGIKAKKEQFQGLVMAPMLVENHKGEAARLPVTTSFSEGIDLGSYFIQASGARRGVIQKVKAVSDPGYMSKLMVQANIDQPITAKDCGTTSGISLPIKNKDVVDRLLAEPVTLNGKSFPAGTVVTPEMLAQAEKERIDKLVVRSPLKCRQPQGVCSHCMGVHPSGNLWAVGENAGLVAAQALGERAAQLMLKQTHGGGIVSLNPHTVRDFEDVRRLFDAAKQSREDALLAPKDATVSKVSKLPQGSWEVHLDNVKNPLRSRQAPTVKAGDAVRKGDKLTVGDPNLHDVLATQGFESAQNYMTNKIGEIYGREGVLRRHVELSVRNAMGLVRVTDPGDHSSVVRGDYMMRTAADALNKSAPGKKPMQYETTLSPVGSMPLRRVTDWMARLQSGDISRSLLVAAHHGQTSDTAGVHPIPGLAHGANYGLGRKNAIQGNTKP